MKKDEFRVVCTDKNQHSSHEILLFVPKRGGPFIVREAGQAASSIDDYEAISQRNRTGHLVETKPLTLGASTAAYRFACAVCRRDVQLSTTKLNLIFLGLQKMGNDTLDISDI